MLHWLLQYNESMGHSAMSDIYSIKELGFVESNTQHVTCGGSENRTK